MVSVNNSTPNEKLTLDMITDKLQNEELEEKVLKWFSLSHIHLFQKSKKGTREAKVKIPISKIMITLEEDSRGEMSNAFTVKK